MIRTIFVCSCIVVTTLSLGVLALVTYPFDRKGRVVHHYARVWGKACLLASLVKVDIEGLEHLNGKGPYIFMPNHQGVYDIFTLLGYLPYQFKWLAKKELFAVPFLGWTMNAAGYISIDRKGTRETVAAMDEAARKIREGMSMVLFPEGSRSPDGSIQPFKKGGFTLAIKSGVPIVPIAINGSQNVMPKGKIRIASGKIKVFIDHPIDIRDCSLKDRENLMNRVREIILRDFKLITAKRPENPIPPKAGSEGARDAI